MYSSRFRCFLIWLVFLVALAESEMISQVPYNATWLLGQGSDSDTALHALEMTFVQGNRAIEKVSRSTDFFNVNSSICLDAPGARLYTNGCAIFDQDDYLIPNSDSLIGGLIYEAYCHFASPVVGGAIFLPLSDTLISLLHLDAVLTDEPIEFFGTALLQTLIVYKEGNVSIKLKSQVLLQDSLTLGHLEAIEEPNGDWWVVVKGWKNKTYHKVRIQPDATYEHWTQTIGDSINAEAILGQSCFSPDGRHFALYGPTDALHLMSFDISTGELSKYQKFVLPTDNNVGGLAFSSNSRFMYVSTQLELYQLDTWAADIDKSVQLIDTFDGFLNPFPSTFYLMQLAPDCKIYMIPPNGICNMHVIDNPNAPGLACNFQQHGIELPVPNAITIPNVPNYHQAMECDSTTSVDQFTPVAPNLSRVFPNPASGFVTIECDPSYADVTSVQVVTASGQQVMSDELGNSGVHTLDVSDLNAGLYFLRVVTIDGVLEVHKLIVID